MAWQILERGKINRIEQPKNRQLRFPSLPAQRACMTQPRNDLIVLCARQNTAEAGGRVASTALPPELSG